MPALIPNNSRLRFSELISQDGIEFWDLPELPELPVSDDDRYHTVQMADRMDLIANTYYGDPVLWWVIAVANDIEVVPTEIYMGQVLRIPSPVYVSQTLFSKARVP